MKPSARREVVGVEIAQAAAAPLRPAGFPVAVIHVEVGPAVVHVVGRGENLVAQAVVRVAGW